MLVNVLSMQYEYSLLLYAKPIKKITSTGIFGLSVDGGRLLGIWKNTNDLLLVSNCSAVDRV